MLSTLLCFVCIFKNMDSFNKNIRDNCEEVTSDDFVILGEVPKKKLYKISRVLPDWLANPTLIDSGLTCRLEDITELDALLLRTLLSMQITHFFAVQREFIPWLLRSDRQCMVSPQPDACISAPTGSGKTLAYVLPLVQILKNRLVSAIRAVIVLPVKDLAIQVHKVFVHYCKGTTLKVGLAAADKLFAKEQNSLVRNGVTGTSSVVDILVATPGRLLDHIQQTRGFSLSSLRYLVVDEADRMMKETQHPWLEAIENMVCNRDTCTCGATLSSTTACSIGNPNSAPFRKLLFSATLSQDPQRLKAMNMFHPKLFVVSACKDESAEGKYSTPAGLTEFQTACTSQTKPLVAWYLLQHRGFRRVLCFTNSLSNTHRLCTVLKEMGGELRVEPFSSRLPQKKRNLLLGKFAQGEVDVLVTSDVLSRGMDVENVECTLLYDCPLLLKTYIHRVGRTARAGRSGTAITLLTSKERQKFKAMIGTTGKDKVHTLNVTKNELRPFIDVYRQALDHASQVIGNDKIHTQQRKNPFVYRRRNCSSRFHPSRYVKSVSLS